MTSRYDTVTARIRGRKLQERNARLAANNPLCVHCQQRGIAAVATEWDHVIPLHKGGVDDESNLQGLCAECHYIKTVKERGDTPKSQQVQGLDWIC